MPDSTMIPSPQLGCTDADANKLHKRYVQSLLFYQKPMMYDALYFIMKYRDYNRRTQKISDATQQEDVSCPGAP